MEPSEQLQILKDLVEINTVNDHEEKVAEYLQQLFNKYGIQSHLIEQLPGRTNLIAEIGDGNGPKIGLAGHEDTVHEGKTSDWSTGPFKAVEKNGNLYGRGTTDMKSGLAAMAITLIELSQNAHDLHGTVRFIATIYEELTQGGAQFLSEKGYVDDLDKIIVGEPTCDDHDQPKLIIAHKGALIYTVESIGKAAHSSTPELGINAIDKLINYRQQEGQMFKQYQDEDDVLGQTIYTPDVFHGGQQVNSIPDYAYQKVMVRTIPQVPNEKIINDLKQLIDQINHTDSESHLKLTVTFSGNPVKTEPNSLVKAIQAASKEQWGKPLPEGSLSLGSDASQYAYQNPKLEIVLLGPGNSSAHQTDEHVQISMYKEFIQFYQKIVYQILKH